MESSTMEGSTRGTLLQQQPNMGTILYSSKDNGWQPVVTPISIIPTEIPKESIIANTDFTMTSVIAKRRLSNKKRRSRVSTDDDTLLQHSPPLSMSKRDDSSDTTVVPPSSSIVPQSSTTVLPSSTSVLPSSSSSSAVSYPMTSQYQGVGMVIPPATSTQQPCIPLATQVYSQAVPPEVVYQILHQQATQGSSGRGSEAAHIPPHQLQYIESSTGQHLTYPLPQSSSSSSSTHHKNQQLSTANTSTSASSNTSITNTISSPAAPLHVNDALEHQMVVAQQQAAAYHHHLHQQQLLQQQQQQLAVMQQLYGVSPAAAAGIVHATNPPPADIRQLQGTTGIPIVGHPSQLISVPIQTVYAQPPSHHPAHSVPIATFAPPELLLQVQNGSWVSQSSAPAPVYGSCIVNPIQHGLLASSLVK